MEKVYFRLQLRNVHLHGFNDIIINVHHFADMVEREVERLNKNGFRISVSDERDMLLETGGGLYKAKDFFDNKPFLLYNADIISDLDLSILYRFHIEKQRSCNTCSRNRRGNRFFLINNKEIRGWRKSTGEKILTGRIRRELTEIAFSGMHIIDPEIFKYMSEGVYHMTALYLKLASEHNIYTFRHDEGYW